MTREQTRNADAVAALRAGIRAAFPDVVFSGRITPADNLADEDFDEERDLYEALHGKKWTDVSVAAIKPLTASLPLLTEDAFRTFLPAWLSGVLDDPEMRDPLVFNFRSNGSKKDTSFMDSRLRPLTGLQKEAILALFSHLLAVGTSEFERNSARSAVEYIRSLT